jgi:hypothetical protein
MTNSDFSPADAEGLAAWFARAEANAAGRRLHLPAKAQALAGSGNQPRERKGGRTGAATMTDCAGGHRQDRQAAVNA